MRIAFVTDKSAPYYTGGYEVRVFELARRLAPHHSVRVFTSLTQQQAQVDGVEFQRIAPWAFQRQETGSRSLVHGALFGASLLVNHLIDWEPDVVIVEAIPYIHLLTMARWAGSGGARYILDVPEAWESYRYSSRPLIGGLAQFVIRAGLRTGIRMADAVLAISSATASSLVENYGVSPSRIHVVPLGFDSGRDRDGRTRPTIGTGSALEGEFDVVAIGRLVESKRFEDLVAALGLLRREYDWRGRAVIVGEGAQLDRLKQQSRSLGLVEQLRLPGFVAQGTKISLLARSRVFVLPSEREGFSLATLEAMAAGLAVIVARPRHSEVFGQVDFLQPGENGLVFPVGDVATLAAQLDELLRNKQRQLELGRAARASAERFTWDRAIESLESIL